MFAPKPTKAQIAAAVKVLNENIGVIYNNQYQPPQPSYYWTNWNNVNVTTTQAGAAYPLPTYSAGPVIGTWQPSAAGGYQQVPFITMEELAIAILEEVAKAWWEGVARKMVDEEGEASRSTDNEQQADEVHAA